MLMRWPDGLDLGIRLSHARCINVIPGKLPSFNVNVKGILATFRCIHCRVDQLCNNTALFRCTLCWPNLSVQRHQLNLTAWMTSLLLLGPIYTERQGVFHKGRE